MEVKIQTGTAINIASTVTQTELMMNGRKPYSPLMGRQLLENNNFITEWLSSIRVDLNSKPKNKINGRIITTIRQTVIHPK
jgi:hypothetical protein